MRTIKKILTRNLLYVLLLVSPFGYSVTSDGHRNSSGATDGTQYIYTDLLELYPQKIVTSRGTYSTLYIPLLDQRLSVAGSPANSQGKTKGKVQLKLNSEKQLLEVILY